MRSGFAAIAFLGVTLGHARPGLAAGSSPRVLGLSGRCRDRAQLDVASTVTRTFEKYLEVMFSSLGDKPSIGELSEPMPETNAPQASP